MSVNEIEQMVSAAGRYVEIASQYLCPLPTANCPEFNQQVRVLLEKFFVHYLFPNLTETERWLLVELRLARARLGRLDKPPRNEFSPEPASRAQREAIELQIKFVDLKMKMNQRALLHKFTPLQREVMHREFLSAPEPWSAVIPALEQPPLPAQADPRPAATIRE